MATKAQRKAASENIKKAQHAWSAMSSRQQSRAQPEGRGREKPGSASGGEFFHVEVRPKSEFKIFRTQDVGESGGIERVAGRRSSGSWDTQKWLISKQYARVGGVGDARKVLKALGSQPKHIRGDRFKAQDRPNVPEREKPTAAQKRARTTNIKKAQSARHA